MDISEVMNVGSSNTDWTNTINGRDLMGVDFLKRPLKRQQVHSSLNENSNMGGSGSGESISMLAFSGSDIEDTWTLFCSTRRH